MSMTIRTARARAATAARPTAAASATAPTSPTTAARTTTTAALVSGSAPVRFKALRTRDRAHPIVVLVLVLPRHLIPIFHPVLIPGAATTIVTSINTSTSTSTNTNTRTRNSTSVRIAVNARAQMLCPRRSLADARPLAPAASATSATSTTSAAPAAHATGSACTRTVGTLVVLGLLLLVRLDQKIRDSLFADTWWAGGCGGEWAVAVAATFNSG